MTATTPHAGRDLTVTKRWARALAGWELELQAADRPATTRYLRDYHLRRLANDFPDRDPWSITRTELVDWLAGWSWSRETRRSYRSSLRSFYAWGQAAGHIAVSPAATLPPITPERGLPRPVPSDRLAAATAAADPRVRLALLLLAETGIRRAELAAAHTDDLLQDCNGWSLRVMGKGRHERRVPVGDSLGQLLTLIPRGWVFPAHHRGDTRGAPRGHLTPAYLGKLVSAALGGGWTAHTVRHRFGTLAYAVERDLRAVQELLGHQKIETTTVYTKVPDGAMRRAAAASSLTTTPALV